MSSAGGGTVVQATLFSNVEPLDMTALRQRPPREVQARARTDHCAVPTAYYCSRNPDGSDLAHTTMSNRERISSVDTAWLRMDRPTNLMMIVGVMMFDRPIAF